jgi:hypothetical protein
MSTDQDGAEFVYLIASNASTLVKIGRSVNVPRRLIDIQRMCPVPLVVLWQTEGGFELETALHVMFQRYRRHGEWFDFGGQDPIELVTRAIALGLHESTEGLHPDSEPLKHGDAVKILRQWNGPAYGVVRGVSLRRDSGKVASYAVGSPDTPGPASYNFPPSILELVTDMETCPNIRELWEGMPTRLQLMG